MRWQGRLRARRVALLVALVLAAPLVGLAVDRDGALAQVVAPPSPPLQVTLVARTCPQYTDITANRARNNIQESLRDLGGDTLYDEGDPISVATETAGQPNPPCTPIPNWTFTLGSGIIGGNPNNLSRITGENGAVTTQLSTAELDENGAPTGASILGAVTFTLDATQAALAADSSSLWIQGGTVADPFNGRAEEFGFAALRCAIDNLNGDNVEWIAFPAGSSHVFCYAYYVTPPPTSATIIVQKETVDQAGNPLSIPLATDFSFQGNISYNDEPFQGAFTVPVAAGASSGAAEPFIRGETDVAAGGTPWTFREVGPPAAGWAYVGVTCDSALGTSQWTIDDANRSVSVTRLVADDTVTCTFRNRPQVTGRLGLVKVTRDGFGGPFGFTITPPDGDDVIAEVSTEEPDVPVLVAQAETGPLGTYTVTETLPADTAAGTWEMTAVACVGVTPTVDLENNTFSGDVTVDGQVAFCAVENTFHPLGAITINKITLGGVGTADFQIAALDPDTGEPGATFDQTATTTTEGVPVTAAGDDLTGLPLGEYQIYETAHDGVFTEAGVWRLTDLDCGPIVGGAGTTITLTAATPSISCTFTDSLIAFGTLTVQKVVSDPDGYRVGDVVIVGTCADGQTFQLVAPAGQPGPWSLEAPIGFAEPTACTIVETQSGATAITTLVETTWAITQGETTSGGTGTGVSVETDLGGDTIVTFTDRYSDPFAAGAGAIRPAPRFTG